MKNILSNKNLLKNWRQIIKLEKLVGERHKKKKNTY